MANEYSVNQSDLVSVANAIRTKGGTSEALVFPDGFVSAVQAIQAGGGGTITATAPKDVNFYDYDGTLLYSYTLEEAQALTALPDGPTHDGLVFDGWNYSLESVKSLTKAMNIGAMYSTDDGTTRVYIHLEDGRTSPMLGICLNGTVTVDWGDGTEPDILTGTDPYTAQWTPTHNYATPGDYVIRLTVDGDAQLWGFDTENTDSYILRYSSGADSRNRVYQNSILKVEIGAGVRIGVRAFCNCCSLSSITIPDSVTTIGRYAFYKCYSLSSITIPDGVPSIGDRAFWDCHSLSSITIPDSVTYIDKIAFTYCCSLSSITIPDGVTSIAEYAFYNCHSLSSITIPDGVTSIGSYAFYNCYGIVYYDFTALSAVPTLSNTDAFTGIVADCKIRVPASLAEQWKAATNWATYAKYIVGV